MPGEKRVGAPEGVAVVTVGWAPVPENWTKWGPVSSFR